MEVGAKKEKKKKKSKPKELLQHREKAQPDKIRGKKDACLNYSQF